MDNWQKLIEFINIPGGVFLMGSNNGHDDEQPIREVTVPPFRMSKFPVTQAQWRAVVNQSVYAQSLNPDPSDVSGDDLPVDAVSWDEAQEWLVVLGLLAGELYRLPTEAEWEYACRAGTQSAFAFGDRLLPEQACFNRGAPTPVGSYPPNAFGLYDMHGLLWEWCEDVWHEYDETLPTDGTAWQEKDEDAFRVLRGGSWNDDPKECRSACRLEFHPSPQMNGFGFRVVWPISS